MVSIITAVVALFSATVILGLRDDGTVKIRVNVSFSSTASSSCIASFASVLFLFLLNVRVRAVGS